MHKEDSHLTEQELVIRLIDSDEEAFCKLYAAYKDKLLYFSLRFLKSQEYAEDVLQDVFTNLWTGRHLINPDIPFSTYLYTIVKNRVLNQLRDLKQRDMLREEIMLHAIDYADTTQNKILSDELKDIINKALATMTPRQREIFRLSREEQLSYKEIAARLNISTNTVHEHISSSLRIIRSYLMKYSGSNIDIFILILFINS